MALKFIKQETAADPAASQAQEVKPAEISQSIAEVATTTSTALEIAVDELIQVEQALEKAEIKQYLKRQTELRKQLASMAPEGTSNSEPVTFTGKTGSVVFSPCSITSTIPDLNKVVESLGNEVFMKIAKVGLTDLKPYLSESEFAKISVKGWGSRSFKAYFAKP